MLEYIISLKLLFLANIFGAVTGYLSSCFIDPILFKEQVETVDSNYKRAIDMFFWGMAIAFAFGVMFFCFAALDYLLSFAPSYSLFSNVRLVENETILSSFMFAFFCGISSTLIRIGEMAFAAYKKNKI